MTMSANEQKIAFILAAACRREQGGPPTDFYAAMDRGHADLGISRILFLRTAYLLRSGASDEEAAAVLAAVLMIERLTGVRQQSPQWRALLAAARGERAAEEEGERHA